MPVGKHFLGGSVIKFYQNNFQLFAKYFQTLCLKAGHFQTFDLKVNYFKLVTEMRCPHVIGIRISLTELKTRPQPIVFEQLSSRQFIAAAHHALCCCSVAGRGSVTHCILSCLFLVDLADLQQQNR